MSKLTDLLEKCQREDEVMVSYEFFPPKTESGVQNLFRRIYKLNESVMPTFVSLSWRQSLKDESVWMKIGVTIQKRLNIPVLLHLTCHRPKHEIIKILKEARRNNIRNILALRGAGSRTQRGTGELRWAFELVQLIRKEHGDFFCIAVAGYPEVHLDCWNSSLLPPSDQSRLLDLKRLKEKVDRGADLVFSQFCFDSDIFAKFQQSCEDMGINVPVIPSYLPPQTWSSFTKFTKSLKSNLPEEAKEELEKLKDNDELLRAYGVEMTTRECKKILKISKVKALHFVTLNLISSVINITQNLKIAKKVNLLHWKGSRQEDEVRPIFWAHRQSSYVTRTADWDEFPNGRWGDSQSAAYGDLSDNYFLRKRGNRELIAEWGIPQNEQDVRNVFVKYMQGEIKTLPWCDESALSFETSFISEDLIWMNRDGFLTINSQPTVNGAPSDDPYVGWGGENGYVFQKSYVEFFCSPENWEKLKHILTSSSEFRSLSYHAINFDGDQFKDSRSELQRVNAVTWGVFPGREIIQPTVVDTESFVTWKEEAFDIWLTAWAAIYHEDDSGTLEGYNSLSEDNMQSSPTGLASSPLRNRMQSFSTINSEEFAKAKETIQRIHDTWYLVNIVDNDYTSESGNLFRLFKRVAFDNMSEEQLRNQVQNMYEENSILRQQLLKAKAEIETLKKKL